jgi:hypothetical protein
MRRARTASAVNPTQRRCPTCASSRVYGTFQGRSTIKNRRIDASSCACLECGAAWHEDYMVRAQQIVISSVRKGNLPSAPTQNLRKPEISSAPASASDPGRLCSVCSSADASVGFNGSSTGDEGRIDTAAAVCMKCGALWSEAYYRRASQTVISDIRREAMKRAILSDRAKDKNSARADNSGFAEFAEDPTRSHAREISHSHHEGDGCPLCGSIHLSIKPHGPASASCSCTTCGAFWEQQYVTSEGKAYRSNIKASG